MPELLSVLSSLRFASPAAPPGGRVEGDLWALKGLVGVALPVDEPICLPVSVLPPGDSQSHWLDRAALDPLAGQGCGQGSPLPCPSPGGGVTPLQVQAWAPHPQCQSLAFFPKR